MDGAHAPAADAASASPAGAAAGGAAPVDSNAKATNAAPAATASGDAPPKKLSGAELKALKQAEKAKRRAAAIASKEAAAAGGSTGAPAAAIKAAAKGAPGGGGGGGGQSTGGAGSGSAAGEGGGKIPGSLPRRPAAQPASGAASAAAGLAAAAGGAAATPVEREKDARSGIPECFSHLPMAKRIPLTQAHKDVNPAVLTVGQMMGSFVLKDSMARVEATMVALKKVIESYQTPPGNAFSRHFVSHVLNPQIEYLIECRPMCFAMGNAIRLLKARVSQIDLDMDDKDAIAYLCESIDVFIQERIFAAADGIAAEVANMIEDGDVILTYGGPRLVRAALERAWATGLHFDLIVVDDPGDSAASLSLAKRFREVREQALRRDSNSRLRDTNVTYCPTLDGIEAQAARATRVFLGAESVFANGALLAPAGTCDVATAAEAQGCPVLTLCETINFDRDRVATDALAHNEIDPDQCDGDVAFRLLFDVTPSHLVGMLVSEYDEATGTVPSHAIAQVLRTREDLN